MVQNLSKIISEIFPETSDIYEKLLENLFWKIEKC